MDQPIQSGGEALPETSPILITVNPRDRLQLATTIENLINLLDEMDEDPDLEPYLAGLHMGSHTDDREGDEGCYGGDANLEPSLGWTITGEMGEQPPVMFGPDLEADDSDDEPGTWIEQISCREYDTVADENLEEQHDREMDPAEDGLADNDAIQSEEFSTAYLGFRGDGRREAEALLTNHQVANGEALCFAAGADVPVVYTVQVSA